LAPLLIVLFSWPLALQAADKPAGSTHAASYVQEKPVQADSYATSKDASEMGMPTYACPVPLLPSPLYFRGEYLSWWTSGSGCPALVTTSPVSVPPTQEERDRAGVLGQPGTQVLFGGENLDADVRSGVRLTLGWWLDPCRLRGIEATWFGLASETTHFFADENTLPVVARPFYNVDLDREDSELVAFPGVLDGSVNINHSTQLDGFEILYRRAILRDCSNRCDFVVGYRYNGLNDNLRITEDLETLDGSNGVAVGTLVDQLDLFDTENDFHGAEVGLLSRSCWNAWTLDLTLKLAMGGNRSTVTIDGSTTVTSLGETATTPNGLLAQPTNMGVYESTNFAVLPQFGTTLSLHVTPQLRATIGYDLMYLSSVARATGQIDRMLNLTQLPPGPLVGESRPAFNLVTSGFWAQGLSVGLHFRY